MEEFDYVIAGAGSAGCVLANRLSADPRNRVLLIESGRRDSSFYIPIPRGFAKLMGHPVYSCVYPALRGNTNEADTMQMRGRGLGGSSSINGMIYSRGIPSDYDDWGCPGWEWPKVLAAYQRIEKHELGASDWRGGEGELRISTHGYGQAACEAFLASARALGLPVVEDLNAVAGEAVGYNARNIWRGRRQSAAHAFLRPAEGRPNLRVVTETTVERIVFEGSRAVGLKVRDRAGVRDVRAGKEVILSTGAIETPKLLQLSGVGPASHLQALGVPVVVDSPEVGANFVEHRGVVMQFEVTRGSENKEFSGWRLYRNVLRQQILGTGPMSRASFEVGGRIKSRPDVRYPDVQLYMGPYNQDYSKKPEIVMAEKPGVTAFTSQMRPESRGYVRIRDADPASEPDISMGYMSADEDKRTAIAGVRRLREIFEQPPMQAFAPKEVFPGPRARSDDEILHLCKLASGSLQHAAGSCRMGVDAAAPLDPSLRVRGVAGLRVADISIMPQVTSGNTNAPAMAIGQRAAEIILGD